MPRHANQKTLGVTPELAKPMCRPSTLPPMPAQCASCPFRRDNIPAWMEVCRKVAAAEPRSPLITRFTAFLARVKIQDELLAKGSEEFVCHATAYDLAAPGLKRRPVKEFRQCAGATAFCATHPKFRPRDPKEKTLCPENPTKAPKAPSLPSKPRSNTTKPRSKPSSSRRSSSRAAGNKGPESA